ncbi:lysosomal acid phosphatase-like protein 3, partial [Dinothrombium tinctorium]
MKFLKTNILITLWLSAYKSFADDSEHLLCVAIVSRHGDRTPVKFYPNDPYRNESYWPDGLGELTQMGKKRMFNLGRYLRKRYSFFLTNESCEMYIQSSERSRCKESANEIARGIYLSQNSSLHSQNNFDFPIKTIPLKQDILLTVKPNCPEAKIELEKVKQSTEFKNINEKYKNLFRFLSERYEANITDVFGVRVIFSNLLIERSTGYKLPNWLNSSLMEQLKTLAGYSFYFTASTKVLQKLRAGMLIDEILTKFQSFNSNGAKKLNDKKKLYIYSTHDTKITALLSALGVFNNLPPYFGST